MSEEAVPKMTSLPASRIRLRDRGFLRAGMAADFVAFDPSTVRERATYADPLHYREGIPYVGARRGSSPRSPAVVAACSLHLNDVDV
jgi:N-acyl-D-aspartate/D-glutamate deacylase